MFLVDIVGEISAEQLRKIAKQFDAEVVTEKELNAWTDVDNLVYKNAKKRCGCEGCGCNGGE